MRTLSILICLVILWSCEEKKQPLLGETPFQKNMNAIFKDASTSPLKANDLRDFRGLDFFKHNEDFITTAFLERTPNSQWFDMKTTTDRLSKERVYGILSFNFKGKSFSLKVYQSEEQLNTEGQENDLFLPFLDNTNGNTTYGGGRYMNLKIPTGDSIQLDFNTAYNPYCAYNEKFSCPIVPRANYIDLEVTAGVKKYVK
ncbi:MAG: DUF1684 domain-containing protein [Bacteroidia bacterium]|nr:DUF1684 domain-containing protein [Bacteroidia bacterium]NNL83545.1 DUF1684 domain-containing protein [Winogradskyella sp.]